MNEQLLAILERGQIKLLKPINLPEGTKLLVTPIFDNDSKTNEFEWYNLSTQGLNQAYDEDEPEYTLENIKEYNKHYEAE